MNQSLVIGFALLFATQAFAAAPAQPEEPQENSILNSVPWTVGPGKVNLGTIASVQVPEGFRFTAGDGTRTLLEAMGNPTSGSELGFLAPLDVSWFVVFRFSDVGYVKDDDKDKLNPDEILKAIRQGTEESNKLRAQMGASPMRIVGWEFPPKYNEQTHNLEWAVRGESDGEPVINYNTRLLGRKGVMEAKLVIDPEKLRETIPVYQSLLQEYSYKTGESYAEYRQGDKLAQFGLAALIAGGAAAVAVKTGLLATIVLFFKKGAKLIIIGLVAAGAFVQRLFSGRKRQDIQ